LFKFKEGENFNHPDEIGTGIHTLSILRIALKLHFVQNLSLTQKLGKRGRFAKVSLNSVHPKIINLNFEQE
jgi:hypothetical protein